MASYALPRELFPDDKVLQDYYKQGVWTPELHKLRTHAWESLGHANSQSDKELARFMPPRIEWSQVQYAQQQPADHEDSDRDLGCGAWIADLASDTLAEQIYVDFFKAFLDSSMQQPLTITQFVAATFSRARVLFVPATWGTGRCTHQDCICKDKTLVINHAFSKSDLSTDQYRAELLFIYIAEGASVILSDTSNCDNGFLARSVIGYVESQAQVKLVSDHHYGSHAFGMQDELWQLAKGATLTSVAALTGGAQTWAVKEFRLADTASVEHISLAALKANEQAALITKQIHEGASSKSSVLVKAVLCESASSFYRGTIKVHEQAIKTDADQQQKALILSPTARTCAIPSLEVATHEVMCRHGSAAGRFNKDELWYLLSRGLTKSQSYDMLIHGFYHDKLRDCTFVEPSSMLSRLKERCRSIVVEQEA